MKVKINFEIHAWAGREKSAPPEKEITLTLSEGDKVGAKELGGFQGSGLVLAAPNLRVTKITETQLEFVTNGLVEYNPPDERGLKTVNLRKDSRESEHRLAFGKTLTLVTQSMDTGFEISITPLEIVSA